MRVWSIVVAAGRGERFGGAKQYEVVAGRRVLDWGLSAARTVSEGVVVVVDAAHVASPEPLADVVVVGGTTRSASVRAGLAVVPEEAEVIVVHDAARPSASPALFVATVAAVGDGADAAVPGLGVVDTIKLVGDDGLVMQTLERASLVAVQTPQAFAAGALRAAHAGAGDATDDAELVEAAGGRVTVVAGEPANAKITEPGDLASAAAHLAGRAAPPRRAGRVGLGFDVHPYGRDLDRPLVLGGVVFEGERGLVGHSDADVVAHAAAEALLGAAGLDDLGTQFPDTDPQWKGADSVKLLTEVGCLVRNAGWEPANVDCSVVLDGPRLAPRRLEMQQRLGTAVGAEVTVRGRRAEGLGALGRGEGIACWAVALLEPAISEAP
ncbi:bifunctional 2-C-methyl-D-erythritol 4-phosphate cytidylyltransferase/2-C-methyl-D-erythritol 2,4-cyclodiphosphate synthase [soil metagenome]